jgi:hypothetical protein
LGRSGTSPGTGRRERRRLGGLPRAGLSPEDNFDVVTERRKKIHQPLDRERTQPVGAKRPDAGPAATWKTMYRFDER